MSAKTAIAASSVGPVISCAVATATPIEPSVTLTTP